MVPAWMWGRAITSNRRQISGHRPRIPSVSEGSYRFEGIMKKTFVLLLFLLAACSTRDKSNLTLEEAPAEIPGLPSARPPSDSAADTGPKVRTGAEIRNGSQSVITQDRVDEGRIEAENRSGRALPQVRIGPQDSNTAILDPPRRRR